MREARPIFRKGLGDSSNLGVPKIVLRRRFLILTSRQNSHTSYTPWSLKYTCAVNHSPAPEERGEKRKSWAGNGRTEKRRNWAGNGWITQTEPVHPLPPCYVWNSNPAAALLPYTQRKSCRNRSSSVSISPTLPSSRAISPYTRGKKSRPSTAKGRRNCWPALCISEYQTFRRNFPLRLQHTIRLKSCEVCKNRVVHVGTHIYHRRVYISMDSYRKLKNLPRRNVRPYTRDPILPNSIVPIRWSVRHSDRFGEKISNILTSTILHLDHNLGCGMFSAKNSQLLTSTISYATFLRYFYFQNISRIP